MTLELVASRLVAPVLGVSLYTWTSIIGAVLAGMSAGSFAGGWMADRRDPRRLLGVLLMVAGSATALIIPALPALQFAAPLLKVPLLRVLLPILAVFGIPSFCIGLVSPVLYRICLNDLRRTGTTVGRLAASGSLGSIAGTFATGFWLIPAIGTRAIVLGVSGGLLILGILNMTCCRRWVKAASLMVLTALLCMGLFGRFPHGLAPDENTRESAYYLIKVTTAQHPTGGTVKKLILDNLVHSAANPENPDFLWYEYERVAAWVISNWAPPALRGFFIGGGGYTLPYWVERHYPGASIEVAEIDPEVTRIALKEFIRGSTRIVTYNEDARTALRNLPADRKYDLIFGDAFNDLSVPYHLTTLEFTRMVRSRMTDNGIYLVNVVDKPDGEFLNAIGSTLAAVFPNVWILAGSGAASYGGRSPHILVASSTSVDVDKWRSPCDVEFALEPKRASGGGLVLTDDHAPVDNLLLPVFAEKLNPR